MEKGWIPRNLDEHDVIKFGMGINLSLSDLPFIASGGVLAYTVSTYIPGVIIKVVIAFGIVSISYIITKIKLNGQKTPELCINGSVYVGRKVYYHRKIKQLMNLEKTSLLKNLSLKNLSLKNLSLKNLFSN